MISRTTISLFTSVVFAFASSAMASETSVYLAPKVSSTAAPTDADIEAAKASYARAQKLFSAGKFAKALDYARTAFRAVPKASSALVVATILAQMKRHCEATEFLMLALELGPHADDLAQVEGQFTEQLQACGAGIGSFQVSPAEAEVAVAGQAVPSGEKLAIAAGQYKVELSAEGHITQQADLTVVAGAPFSFSAALAPLPAPAPPPTPEPVEPVAATPPPQPVTPPVVQVSPADGSDTTVLGWSLVGTGAAATLGGVVLFTLALSAADDVTAANNLAGVSDQERRSQYDAAKADVDSFQLGAYVVGGLGLAAATAGTVLLLLDGEPGEGQAMGPTGWWGSQGAFVGVGGHF